MCEVNNIEMLKIGKKRNNFFRHPAKFPISFSLETNSIRDIKMGQIGNKYTKNQQMDFPEFIFI